MQAAVYFCQQFFVARLFCEFVTNGRVIKLCNDLAEALGLCLEQPVLADHLLGSVLAIPEVTLAHLGLQVVSASDLVVIVKESRGSSKSAPRDH